MPPLVPATILLAGDRKENARQRSYRWQPPSPNPAKEVLYEGRSVLGEAVTQEPYGTTGFRARRRATGSLGVGSFESTNNLVAGNLIGTKKNGITALGNSSGGVSIIRASNNTVSDNTIAFNGEHGVGIFSIGTGNLLAGISIFSNVEEGIDLGLD
jgi:hypothetical protein